MCYYMLKTFCFLISDLWLRLLEHASFLIDKTWDLFQLPGPLEQV